MIPQLRALEHEFADVLAIIGVHSPKFPAEKVPANVRAAVQRLGVDHAVVSDVEFDIWQAYGVRAWPTLMFIDPAGRVFGVHEGEFPLDAVREMVRDALASYSADGELDRRPLPHTPLPPGGGQLRFPGKVLTDSTSNRLFIADTGHHRILVADTNGAVSMAVGAGTAGFQDGAAGEAQFNHPQGMALAAGGSRLQVADTANHAIREINLATGDVTTLAGTGEQGRARSGGPARAIPLSSPWDIVWHGHQLWIAMAGLHQLWTLDPETGTVAIAAGTGAESIHDGSLADATFAQPSGITTTGEALFVADSESSAIRRVAPLADRVQRLVGRGLFTFGDLDGQGDAVRLQHPLGVCAVMEQDAPVVYLADSYNDKIKRLDPRTRRVETLFEHGAFDGASASPAGSPFWEPGGLCISSQVCYVADTNNHAIRRANLASGEITTLPLGAAAI
ncbi:MAG TPA: alkyl hydroperoxide reductase [Thermomicrobiales bacterium]|nr:alkyl hydroperoxide reductase [Thermomicrobiales bacterium]